MIHSNAKEAIVGVARGKLRVLKAYSPARELENLDSGRKKLEFGLGRKKWANSDGIDTGGGANAVTIGGIPSWNGFRVIHMGNPDLTLQARLRVMLTMQRDYCDRLPQL